MKRSRKRAQSENGHLSFSTALFNLNVAILDNLCYFGEVPYSDAYKQALAGMLEAALKDLESLEQRRVQLQAELDATISSIDERLTQTAQFRELWQRSTLGSDPASEARPLANEKSFTRAIAFILKRANRSLSPIEIKELLTALGFATDKYKSDVVSSVHTVLKRFLASDPPAVVETGEARRKKYRWIAEAGRTSGLE